ncbi:hypothetical protein WJX77_001513 [Trebouxia sp. C0004]
MDSRYLVQLELQQALESARTQRLFGRGQPIWTGQGKGLLGKGPWLPVTEQDSSQSATASSDLFKVPVCISQQPIVQARSGLLQATTPFLKAHIENHPGLWPSAVSAAASNTDCAKCMADAIREQQQSFTCLLQQ